MKICVLGNSVGLKLRPPRVGKSDLTYSEILERNGHEVRNVCKAGCMINEAFAYIDDEVIAFFPDIVILNFGVVEICPRQLPRVINNSVIVNYYRNSIIGRTFVFDNVWQKSLRFLGRGIGFLFRKVSKIASIRWQWLPSSRYGLVLRSTIEAILKETGAKVIVLGINPCSQRIESALEGTQKEIDEANAKTEEVCSGFSSRVEFINPCSLIPPSERERLVADGIHFTADGHRFVATRLLESLRL